MKELLRGKGTKSHMAEVPKRTPLAKFTYTFFYEVFEITHNDAPHSVELLWTSDQSVAETST
jgi:hypothetical protein